MFRRIVDAVYSFVAAILNSLGFRAPTPWNWVWTVKDELGGANQEIVEHFKRYMRNEAIKAGQFALRVDGSLVMSAAFTWAGEDYPITRPDSVMRIASCSKTFTTAAIHRIHRLRRDEPVFWFLGITEIDPDPTGNRPAADPRVRDITVAHLVAHQGGWDYTGNRAGRDPVFDLKNIGRIMFLDKSPEKMEFATYIYDYLTLDFEPGRETKYSNIGYVLLGMVIEKATGRSYIEYLNEELLSSMGINDVFVGATKLAGRRENEVLYEDPFIGPDATEHPLSPAAVPLPYGGFGSMTELMDSSGGLITSARSLSAFINNYNNYVNTIDDPMGRRDGKRRFGAMPGTSACAYSFSSKNGSKKFDYAFMFNQRDKGDKEVSAVSAKLDRFCQTLDDLVQANY
jgi:N-acyl-D-amino-acid deacylase